VLRKANGVADYTEGIDHRFPVVKLPAASEYPTLSTKYYIYELLWNSRFELNHEWPFVRW